MGSDERKINQKMRILNIYYVFICRNGDKETISDDFLIVSCSFFVNLPTKR